ncbi:hypothetical protein POM88_003645 [Heracleum sosnowskyi]|uniref:Uncharacterized protein n=1 Tax=Heracleum sosnowskyi TaxID=360622 RepID=A0AAD8N713_9APIA|nr:hypothetical protein POM88_003645 [Heracleum sosnowskyi]
MIQTSIHDSPSLKFTEEPHSDIGGHHLLDDLLDHQSIISETLVASVAPNIKSISTNSTLVSTSIAISFPFSTNILHPFISVSPSTDMPHSSHPLKLTTTTSMDINHPFKVSSTLENLSTQIPITSVEDLVVVETLLGMRAGSESLESERLDCFQAKGEEETKRQAISSSLVKERIESSTLVGEGEGVRCVSQGESLMQENREIERNASTRVIRMEDTAIASDLMDVNETERERLAQLDYQNELSQINLNAETFTHPEPAYQVLDGQGNVEVWRMLNLVHNTESMLRAKDAITNLPPGAGEDFEYEGENSESENGEDMGSYDVEGEDAGPSTLEGILDWLFSSNFTQKDVNMELLKQYQQAFTEHQ